MKKTNYKDKNKDELIKTLLEKREDLRKFRFGITGSKTTNTKHGHNLKKDVARIMTELVSMQKKENLTEK